MENLYNGTGNSGGFQSNKIQSDGMMMTEMSGMNFSAHDNFNHDMRFVPGGQEDFPVKNQDSNNDPAAGAGAGAGVPYGIDLTDDSNSEDLSEEENNRNSNAKLKNPNPGDMGI